MISNVTNFITGGLYLHEMNIRPLRYTVSRMMHLKHVHTPLKLLTCNRKLWDELHFHLLCPLWHLSWNYIFLFYSEEQHIRKGSTLYNYSSVRMCNFYLKQFSIPDKLAQVLMLWLVLWRCLISVLARALTVLTEVFYGVPQSFPVITWLIPFPPQFFQVHWLLPSSWIIWL